jgi:DNA-binding LacI/PurR family transcriptional regulator
MPLVRRIVNHARPSAMAFLRTTPDDNTMNFLFHRKIPTVVIHGDLRSYRSPIIGHIVPDQQHIALQMGKWIRWLAFTVRPRKVIIGAMQPETGDNRTIRSERISLIEQGLRSAGLRSHRFEVPDYSAANALAILTAHPDADAFACLSDELALGVAHLLIARDTTDGLQRVLGFDGSSLARKYGIATIDQNLDRIGDTVAETLTAFFTRFPASPEKWPSPREIPCDRVKPQ